MAQLQHVGEFLAKPTPSMGYNNLSCTGNLIAYAHQQDYIVLRPLGPHKLPIKDSEKNTIQTAILASLRGRVVAALVTDLWLQVWDLSRDIVLAEQPTAVASRGAAFVEAGERLFLAVGHGTGAVSIVEFAADFTPTVIAQPQFHAKPVTCIASNAASHATLATGDNTGTLVLWRADFTPIVSIPQSSEDNCITAVCHTGAFVVASYGCGKIRGFFPHSGELRLEICAHSRWITAMCFSGGMIAAVGEDSLVSVWLLPSNENPRASLVGAKQLKNLLLTGVAFTGDGKVMTAAFDNDKILCFAMPGAAVS